MDSVHFEVCVSLRGGPYSCRMASVSACDHLIWMKVENTFPEKMGTLLQALMTPNRLDDTKSLSIVPSP